MQKLAILQLIPQLDIGGAEQSTLEMVDALHKAGVTALVATEGGRMAAELVRLGGEIVTMKAASKSPLQIWRNARQLRSLIRERGVVLVHARSRAPAWSGLIAARRAGIPFVTTYHGIYSEQEPFKRYYNSVMARGDIVIANSRFTADIVNARYDIGSDRLRIVYRGVDPVRFARAAVASQRIEALRRQWGIDPSRPVILHPARLSKIKGQGVVIEAARVLRDAGHLGEAIVVFAGEAQGRDDYERQLQQQIDRASLQEHVRLVGHCADMPAAYCLARVTLIASIVPETFGRTSTEAQALGCPVIAADIGAPPETVRAVPFVDSEAATGWLVPPNDVAALAEALRQALAQDETEREAMARRAIDNVVSHFSDVSMKLQTLAIYDELLGTRLVAAFRHANSRTI